MGAALKLVEPISEHLRPVTAIVESPTKRLRRNPLPPPPRIAWLALDQLVIDETYQRSVSDSSMRLIRRLVETWTWSQFKPLSVAPVGDGRYEVIDGQHTAIAAATHGGIETLPCLVLDVTTLQERSAAFVGINSDRVSLTPYALYRARLAAQDPGAVAVEEALTASGARLEESLRYDVDYPAGTVACIRTLHLIAKRGGAPQLARLLQICIAASITPVWSDLLKGLEIVVGMKPRPRDDALVEALAAVGGDTISDDAKERKRLGLAPTHADACAQVILKLLEKGGE